MSLQCNTKALEAYSTYFPSSDIDYSWLHNDKFVMKFAGKKALDFPMSNETGQWECYAEIRSTGFKYRLNKDLVFLEGSSTISYTVTWNLVLNFFIPKIIMVLIFICYSFVRPKYRKSA